MPHATHLACLVSSTSEAAVRARSDRMRVRLQIPRACATALGGRLNPKIRRAPCKLSPGPTLNP